MRCTTEKSNVRDIQISLYEEHLSDGSTVHGLHIGNETDILSIDVVDEDAAHEFREGLIDLLTKHKA